MRTRIAAALLAAHCWAAAGAQAAEDKDPRPAKALQDNSFLIEEAYNQEPGVVQHIATLHRQGRDRTFTFVQEWPLGSQRHQFSYSLPYLWLHGEEGRVAGPGDATLDYRYQVSEESAARPAIAARVSLILPTGDFDKGTGNDSLGTGFGLAVSKIVSDRVTLHANAGLETYFDVLGRRPTDYRLGGSAVYALTRETNLLLEAVGEWTESVDEAAAIEREFTFTLLPGVRHAFNLPGDAQLVMGIGAPVSFTGSQRDYGVFLYLSLEHKFLR